MARSVFVFTHGHCFDGLASATVFRHLLSEQLSDRALNFTFRSCGYGPRMQTIPERWMSGDINAILDFRYTESDKLQYYFDHHITAFGSDAEMLRATQSSQSIGRVVAYEPTYGSCTKLLADRSEQVFGRPLSALGELVHWADVIDAARFTTVEEALRDTAAQRLAAIVERHGDAPFLTRCVGDLLQYSLDEVVTLPSYRELFEPIAKERDAYASILERRAKRIGSVLFVDILDQVTRPSAKFLPYALYPDITYSVLLLRTEQLIKVSVGHNPWSPAKRTHDIAAMCRKNGGGGHPFVGAFTLKLGAVDDARLRARSIVDALNVA